ncbi:unnamed protein product [Pleuronectes platessa]|uniref:Uncharacterized protein n=1 Tax=Pleuronectes platessa TaxID=8262 RepID=A0A9N7VNI7_PLEPL|nr:unnamed protein product [Pleuronectes platessa]
MSLVSPEDRHMSLVSPEDRHMSLVSPEDRDMSLVSPEDRAHVPGAAPLENVPSFSRVQCSSGRSNKVSNDAAGGAEHEDELSRTRGTSCCPDGRSCWILRRSRPLELPPDTRRDIKTHEHNMW